MGLSSPARQSSVSLPLPALGPSSAGLHGLLVSFKTKLRPKKFSLSCSSAASDPLFVKAARCTSPQRDLRSYAGRSKKKAGGGSSTGRIEGNAEFRREVKRNARRKSKKLAESLFYRLKSPNRNYADNFTEDELQEIGLGYDRMVRFMQKDDPNLRHPYDWYKYGEFGPYSWRGVVLGDPIRGRFSDERVAMISDVRDAEEWDKIEQFEMAQDFGNRLQELDRSKFRRFWVFVRHPRWRISELPWEQWTLVSEVVLEAGKQRLDKWSLMGRLGSLTRSLITKCAAWMRPDIIYVKRPVYQCRFEPQADFFKVLMPFLDPSTEQEYLFELENDDRNVELCTYFGGLCKIVKVNPKAFVDDVVKAYEKLSDEKKSKCLGFLLKNHPVELLHPYTKEWKAKLEELELGCDAPDGEEGHGGNTEFVDWVEEEEEAGDDNDVDEDDVVMDVEDDGDDELGVKEEDSSEEEDQKYWEAEFQKALSSSEKMEKLVKRSVELTTEHYKKQLRTMEKEEQGKTAEDGDETAMRGKRAKVTPEEWKIAGIGPWRRRIKKSKIPPELFLRAAVRPFTYRNLVKEIVLTRHAILDGDISVDDQTLTFL
ncbi:hypothetical protein FNV43_RR25407 [Rhamnella rubrinervis]|uniref:Uncharacterized protein n=1 Tax=Rhamnella rubrinervis TaxID=2594499 RepID=A0A8K0GQ25_9ROSA|nr:hypothetical protein FNV43_RR25407 [Rhamnella rubrinervis]